MRVGESRMQGSVRRLVLGAALAAFPGAIAPTHAFERPMLPSEAPMEPCPSQGAGFVRIPGTSTCIRLSGRVRAGADLGPTRATMPAQGRITIDARSDSALGPVRSFVRIDAGRP